jgi:integrase
MLSMGRRRKNDLGLEPRVYFSDGSYYYVHKESSRWENLGKDKNAANTKGRLYNDPDRRAGTLVYWLDMFLVDCEARVALKSTIKGIRLSQRTLEDYRMAIGTNEEPGPLCTYFPAPISPLDVEPGDIQAFLRDSARAGRAVRGNREKAALSSCFGWLLREKKVDGLRTNPCLRSAGVQRNPEAKRARYVTDDEYEDVYEVATKSERLLMTLTYRTLQRPESDIIRWQSNVAVNEASGRFLRFTQNKTGRVMVIAMSPELEELIPLPEGNVRALVEPLVRRRDGHFYTYSGLCSMLKRSLDVANERRRTRGSPTIKSFGYRDLKGKGATDMWLAKVPIEQIQALLGHANKTTTEIYIKQRWQVAVAPNMVTMAQKPRP